MFKETPNLIPTNIVDKFYKYSLIIETYNNMLTYKKVIFPFTSINHDKTIKGQPEYLRPSLDDDKNEEKEEEPKKEEKKEPTPNQSITDIEDERAKFIAETQAKIEPTKECQSEQKKLSQDIKFNSDRKLRKTKEVIAMNKSKQIMRSNKLNVDDFRVFDESKKLPKKEFKIRVLDDILKKVYGVFPPI